MIVHEVEPSADIIVLLPGAQFADAYCIRVDGVALDARTAAGKIFARSPRWIEALLRLRNILVTPFGLKTSGAGESVCRGVIGLFPVVSETTKRIVLGFDDSHLDFRVVLDVTPAGSGQQIVLTTLVRKHNFLGRAYLATILPFHRPIARTLLRQVAV